MGPVEALERSRVVEIRRRLMAPKVAKEASEPMQVVRRYAPNLRQLRAVYAGAPKPAVIVKVKLQPNPKTPVTEIVDLQDEDPGLPETASRRGLVQRIIMACARKYDVTPLEVRGKKRKPAFVRARQEAMFRIHCELGLSAVVIGRSFARDHTTVLHGIKAHMKRNPEAAAVYQQLVADRANDAEYNRNLAISVYASGCANVEQVARIAKMSRFKARQLLVESGLLAAAAAGAVQ